MYIEIDINILIDPNSTKTIVPLLYPEKLLEKFLYTLCHDLISCHDLGPILVLKYETKRLSLTLHFDLYALRGRDFKKIS